MQQQAAAPEACRNLRVTQGPRAEAEPDKVQALLAGQGLVPVLVHEVEEPLRLASREAQQRKAVS